MKPWLSPIADELVKIGSKERRGTGSIYKDDAVIRLVDIDVDRSGKVTLRCQKAMYSDQVQSNLIVDFSSSQFGKDDTLRNILRAEYGRKLPELGDERLVNSIGIACMLFYNDDGYWAPLMIPRPPESAGVVSVFEGGWHCSASGAAEWTEAKDKRFDRLIADDMYREIYEELGIEAKEIEEFALVSICRELARAGKPQLFFTGFVNLGFDEIMNRIDIARKDAQKRGDKVETLKYPIYRARPFDSDFFHEIQRREHVDPGSKEIIRPGITTEGAAALYYAARVLAIYAAAIKE